MSIGRFLSEPQYLRTRHWFRELQTSLGVALRADPAKLALRIAEYATIVALAESDIRYPSTPSKDGEHVLFFVGPGGFLQLTAFSIAVLRRLEKEGYNSEVVVCDGALEGCEIKMQGQSDAVQAANCDACFGRAKHVLAVCAVPYRRYSAILGAATTALEARLTGLSTRELAEFEYEDTGVGLHALAGALRYLRRGTLDFASEADRQVLLRYLRSAIRTTEVARILLAARRPDRVVMTHGIYASWGPALDVFNRAGIPVAVFDQSPVFRDRFVTSWNRPSQTYAMGQHAQEGLESPLRAEEAAELQSYLASRRRNTKDRVQFNVVGEEERAVVREKLGIPAHAPCAGLFSNLTWDAATVGTDVCFDGQLAWVQRTIELFGAMPERFLVIRPHPAEFIRGTREALAEVMRERSPKMPKNIILLDRPLEFNAYSIYRSIDLGLVNTSTVGLEMALLGMPVVTLGASHYRGRGFTFDPDGADAYTRMLTGNWPGRLAEEAIARAERYAHAFYFRHHVKFPFFEEAKDSNAIVAARLHSADAQLEENFQDWLDAFRAQDAFVTRRRPAVSAAQEQTF